MVRECSVAFRHSVTSLPGCAKNSVILPGLASRQRRGWFLCLCLAESPRSGRPPGPQLPTAHYINSRQLLALKPPAERQELLKLANNLGAFRHPLYRTTTFPDLGPIRFNHDPRFSFPPVSTLLARVAGGLLSLLFTFLNRLKCKNFTPGTSAKQDGRCSSPCSRPSG